MRIVPIDSPYWYPSTIHPPETLTLISSHYVFFDPAQTKTQTGEVDFSQPVLGIITDLPDLIASDFLGEPTATYLSPAQRGLEAGDSAFILGPNKIGVDWAANSPGDYIRVITVPEPATWSLLALGLAACALRQRVAKECFQRNSLSLGGRFRQCVVRVLR